MNDIGKQINTLIKPSGKSASKMTHALKYLGNGDMQTGIERVADYFTKEGIKIGEVRGFINGTVVGVSLILLIQQVMMEHQKHKVEGKAILKGLEDGMTDYENNKIKDSTCDVVIVEAQGDDSSELLDNQSL